MKAEAARKAEERLKYMTFYSTTQDCLRGFLLHYFGEAAPKKCGNCSCCLAAEQEAQLQVEYSRRRAADNARRLTEKPRRTKAVAGELSEFDQKLLNASMLSASGWPESRISRPLWCSAMPPAGNGGEEATEHR